MGDTQKCRPANDILSNGAIDECYIAWYNQADPSEHSHIGKVARCGRYPKTSGLVFDVYWVAQRTNNQDQPWRIIWHSLGDWPVAIAGKSGHSPIWKNPVVEFGIRPGRFRIPESTPVLSRLADQQLLISRRHGDGQSWWRESKQTAWLEHQIHFGDEYVIVFNRLPPGHDDEKWSLAIIQEVIECCGLDPWYEGIPEIAFQSQSF